MHLLSAGEKPDHKLKYRDIFIAPAGFVKSAGDRHIASARAASELGQRAARSRQQASNNLHCA